MQKVHTAWKNSKFSLQFYFFEIYTLVTYVMVKNIAFMKFLSEKC